MFARVRLLALVALVACAAALVVAGAITLADSLQSRRYSKQVLRTGTITLVVSNGLQSPGQRELPQHGL